MAVRVRVRPRVGVLLAHAVLAPDGHDVGAFRRGDGRGVVGGEGVDGGGEVGQQPGGQAVDGAVAFAEESDGAKEAVQGAG